MPYTAEQIARVCHEANRGLQHLHADPGVPVAAPWDAFDEQDGVIAGVESALAGADAEELHDTWSAHKRADGWTYGPVKDAEVKTHPCLVGYDDLPERQRDKDELFAAIVGALGEVAELPPPDLTARHPAVADLMGWLAPNDRLEGVPAVIASWCHAVALSMVRNLDDSAELTTGLRKLLEAKDALVRASLPLGSSR